MTIKTNGKEWLDKTYAARMQKATQANLEDAMMYIPSHYLDYNASFVEYTYSEYTMQDTADTYGVSVQTLKHWVMLKRFVNCYWG